MSEIKKYIIGIIILLMGCQTDKISPPDLLQRYRDRMVVNAVLTSGKPAKLILTNSISVIDSTGLRGISNANVELQTISDTKNMVYVQGDTNYTSNAIFNPGESLNLKIEHPDFVNVSSVVRFPDNVNTQSTMTIDGGLDTSGLAGDLLQVSFNDPTGQTNYYKLNIYYWNQTISEWIPLAFTKSDPSLTAYNSYTLNDAGVIFSDELFDGSSKVISTVAPSGIVAGNTGNKYLIRFSHISLDFYEYYRSIQRAQDAKEVSFEGGFNNAVVIHSNINNGLGILATQTTNDFILK